MTWYAKGTFSNTAGSPVITGTGTEFVTAKIRAGDGFIISNEVYEIKSVESETQLTLIESVATANTNATYSIIPITGAISSGAYIEGEVVKAVTNALRRDETYLIAFSDMLYNPTPAMIDVRLPDGTVISVPNWALATRAANTQDWADALKVELTAIQTDVKARQTDVTQKQTDVSTKATAAANSATLASKWAENPEDSPVTPGHFSALHYAAKSGKSAAQADTDAQATAADRMQTGADRVQTGKDVVAADGFAADAKKSAGEAAQYDPTKSVVFHGVIPAADDINTYIPDVGHRGVWYITGGTLANHFPVEGFTGSLEVFMVDSSGIQRATHQDGQVYFRWYQTNAYSANWIPMALGGANSTITSLTGLAGSLRLGADGSLPTDATTLRQMQQAIAAVSSAGGINGVMSTFIGDVSWWAGDAGLLPTGYVMPSGQLDKRSDYPEVWALINSGALRSTTEALWNDAAGTARGVFTKGTITTGADANFRWPDLNGGVSGSIAGLFLRGPNGPADAGGIGTTRASAAPNITGQISFHGSAADGSGFSPVGGLTGAFVASGPTQSSTITGGARTSVNAYPVSDLSASRSNAAYGRNGATEVRPNSVSGYWIMRAKGTFSAQTDFGVFAASALTASATLYGGTVRSVHNYTSGTTEAFLRAKTLTNSSSAVSKKSLEVGVQGGTGLVEVGSDGSIVSPVRVTSPTLAVTASGYELNFTNQANGTIQINKTSNVSTMDFGGLNVQNINQFYATNNLYAKGGLTAYTQTGPIIGQGAPIMASQIRDNGTPNGRVRANFDFWGRGDSSGERQGVIRVHGDDMSNEANWIYRSNGRISGSAGLVAIDTSSDEKLKIKKGDVDLSSASDRINQFEMVEYYWNNHRFNKQREVDINELQRGVVAQQIQKISPTYVRASTVQIGTVEDGYSEEILNLNESAILMDAIATIKYMSGEIAELKAEVELLKAGK